MPTVRLPRCTIAIGITLGGCTAAPDYAVDPLSGAPADFTVDLTILGTLDGEPTPPVHLRPGRFVLFPDGSLHFGLDEDRGVNWLPLPRRALNRAQVAELWSDIQQLGFTDSARTDPLTNWKHRQPQADQVVYLLALTGHGKRWGFQRTVDVDGPADSAIGALARRLAHLAWASDLPPTQSPVIPRRYDFGDDPYQRYRRP